jgi:uroporphyrinogen-III decarboxylase
MAPTPRARARLLARSGRAEPGLFAPLVLAQAAEIEALDLRDFLTNPTKLAKGLAALHQALGTDAITTAGADGLLAEAAGAELDWSSYPPVVVTRPGEVGRGESTDRIDAAVEATVRLAATAPGDPVLMAALTGPATLAQEVIGDGFSGLGEAEATSILEALGELILEVLKRFLEAGTNLVVVVEDWLPPAGISEGWRSVITPLVNVARFHQAAPVMVMGEGTPEACTIVPAAMGLCVPEGTSVTGPPNRIRGATLPTEPKEWAPPPPGTALTLTAGVVPGRCSFAETHEACRRVIAG